MSHLFALLTEEAPAQLIMPNWAFPAIAAGFFIVVALVTFSFRDVSNRHRESTDDATSDAGHGHH
jgi:hypothetical protein